MPQPNTKKPGVITPDALEIHRYICQTGACLAQNVAEWRGASQFPGHFDPSLLQSFQRCAPDFERIFRELAD